MNEAINHWITQYGVLGVFLAAVIEGELGVLIGGAMAHLGRLNPLLVTLAAWSAGFISAQTFFYVGRSNRDSRWVQKVTNKRAFELALNHKNNRPAFACGRSQI